MDSQEKIGHEFARLRKGLRISQAKLAAALGINQPLVSEIERGVPRQDVIPVLRAFKKLLMAEYATSGIAANFEVPWFTPQEFAILDSKNTLAAPWLTNTNESR